MFLDTIIRSRFSHLRKAYPQLTSILNDSENEGFRAIVERVYGATDVCDATLSELERIADSCILATAAEYDRSAVIAAGWKH